MIYIPLCLYLYTLRIYLTFLTKHIYIPLCLYLYSSKPTWVTGRYYIYIPLCLYLYYKREKRRTFRVKIYIPLCLYLYRRQGCKQLRTYAFTFHYVYIYIIKCTMHRFRHPDLHSTMFIFISFCQPGSIRSMEIYIPLCLYLYRSLRFA